MTRGFYFLLPALLLLSLGCSGSTDGRVEVEGTVMFKNSPLDQGTIQFMTKEKGEMAGMAQIKDGKFHLPAQQGLTPGSYRIVISSGEAGTKATESAPGESGPPAKERIPKEYNVDSLKKPVYRDVVAGQKNQLEFNIP